MQHPEGNMQITLNLQHALGERNDSGLPRYYGLSFREFGSRVGRNQTIVMRICDRWIVEGTIDRHGRSHPPQCILPYALPVLYCISEVLEPVVLPYPKGLATVIFQQDNARPHEARIDQRYFVNHQIELLPWPARSQDLSRIENIWSKVAQ
ncbi:hypothetical protein TNCV_3692571 [Trichonephila clavipes]|nr:hypothetical protein TNCV_3692571 [Trichonephila clavipes]